MRHPMALAVNVTLGWTSPIRLCDGPLTPKMCVWPPHGGPTTGRPIMSVTLTPDTSDLRHSWGVACHTFGTVGHVATHTEALAVRERHLLVCNECAVYGCHTTATPEGHADAPSVNLSNSNAGAILRLLGLYEEGALYGKASASDLAGRAEAYLTLSESPAVAWNEYAVRRVTEVAEVARYAARYGLAVCWG